MAFKIPHEILKKQSDTDLMKILKASNITLADAMIAMQEQQPRTQHHASPPLKTVLCPFNNKGNEAAGTNINSSETRMKTETIDSDSSLFDRVRRTRLKKIEIAPKKEWKRTSVNPMERNSDSSKRKTLDAPLPDLVDWSQHDNELLLELFNRENANLSITQRCKNILSIFNEKADRKRKLDTLYFKWRKIQKNKIKLPNEKCTTTDRKVSRGTDHSRKAIIVRGPQRTIYTYTNESTTHSTSSMSPIRKPMVQPNANHKIKLWISGNTKQKYKYAHYISF